MKRLLCIAIAFLVLLSGCASNVAQPEESSAPPPTVSPFTNEIPEVDIVRMESYMEDLCDRLYRHEVSVYEYEGGFSVHISMAGMLHESTFVEFVVDGTQTLQKHLSEFEAPLHEFNVTFTITDPSDPYKEGTMIWSSEDLITGVFGDTSYGRTLFMTNATLSDISKTYDYFVLYPIGSISKYISEAECSIPDNLFVTTAEENGLAGTVYHVIADIIEAKQTDGLDMVIAEYEGQQFAVVNFTSYAAGIDDIFIKTDPLADYSLPPVNSSVAMYLTYRGFSGTLQLPVFFLGANEYCVETIRTS